MDVKWQKAGGLVALCLIMFVVTLDTTITNIALPDITRSFSTTLDTSNWISTVYVLILSVLMIPMAKIADQLGRKRLMVIGLILFGIGSLACGLAKSIGMLIAMRTVQGLSGAIVTPIIVPLSVDLFGRAKANQIVGVIGAAAAVAAAAGPPIGGLLIHLWSWHEIFFVNVPIVLLTLGLVAICFHESYDTTISKSIDYIGIVLLSSGLFFVTFVLLKGYDYGWQSLRITMMSGSAVVLLGLFVILDLRRQEPLIEFRLFRDLTFLSSTLIYFTCGFAVIISSVVFNFFLENVRNFGPLHAGYIIMFSSLTVVISLPVGSQLGQKLDYRWSNVTGVLLMTIGGLLLTQLTYQVTGFTMMVNMAIIGLGFGFASLSLVSAVQYIPVEKAGIASGMINAARQLGTCLGIAMLVGVLNHNVANAKTAIKASAYQNVRESQVSPNVRTALDKVIHHDTAANHAKATLAAKSLSNVPKPIRTSELSQLYVGASKLSQANEKMTGSLKKLREDTERLPAFSQAAVPIIKGSQILTAKQKELKQGISLVAQAATIKQVQNKIVTKKHSELTKAFTKTFWVAFICLALMCPVAFWTDRPNNK